MTTTFNMDYIVDWGNQLDNLPMDITTLIIRHAPTQDLTNLPFSLQYIYFRNEDVLFDEYEIEDEIEDENANEINNYRNENADEINNYRDDTYFNYVQPYEYPIPNSYVNTYSFALYPEPAIKTFKLKVPFGCKIFNCRNLKVIPNGFFKVRN